MIGGINWTRLALLVMLLGAMPTSTTYKLNNYSFGTGGTSSSSSTLYGLNGVTGEQSTTQTTGSTYKGQPGNNYTQNTGVPTVTFTNDSTQRYNKLLLVINPGSNPTDTLYAVQIDTNSGFSAPNYVKSDNTIGGTLVYPTDYRTYSGWGSGSGTYVIGLSMSTTYYVRAKAIQGKYSETAYGPSANATTITPTMSFTLTTDTQSSPPFSINIGSLPAGTPVSATSKANISYNSNAENGSFVYLSSANAGLKSTLAGNYTIPSATADLAVATTGYGARGSNTGQTTGGPISVVAPFNVAANNVGGLTTAYQPIFSSPGPVTAGLGSIIMAARSKTVTPAANDYLDTIVLIFAGSY